MQCSLIKMNGWIPKPKQSNSKYYGMWNMLNDKLPLTLSHQLAFLQIEEKQWKTHCLRNQFTKNINEV